MGLLQGMVGKLWFRCEDNAFGDADMSRALRSGSMTPGAFATPGGRIKRVGSNAEMALVGL